jgi:hypothetical protein
MGQDELYPNLGPIPSEWLIDDDTERKAGSDSRIGFACRNISVSLRGDIIQLQAGRRHVLFC